MLKHQKVKGAFTPEKTIPGLMAELGFERSTVVAALKLHGLKPKKAKAGRKRGVSNKNVSSSDLRCLSIAYQVLSNPDACYQEIGDKYGITRERVRQIRAAAIKAGFEEKPEEGADLL